MSSLEKTPFGRVGTLKIGEKTRPFEMRFREGRGKAREILFLCRVQARQKVPRTMEERLYGDREFETGLIVVRDEVIPPLDATAEIPVIAIHSTFFSYHHLPPAGLGVTTNRMCRLPSVIIRPVRYRIIPDARQDAQVRGIMRSRVSVTIIMLCSGSCPKHREHYCAANRNTC